MIRSIPKTWWGNSIFQAYLPVIPIREELVSSDYNVCCCCLRKHGWSEGCWLYGRIMWKRALFYLADPGPDTRTGCQMCIRDRSYSSIPSYFSQGKEWHCQQYSTPGCCKLHLAIAHGWFPSPPPHPGQYLPRYMVQSPQFSPHRDNSLFSRLNPFIPLLLSPQWAPGIFIPCSIRISEQTFSANKLQTVMSISCT